MDTSFPLSYSEISGVITLTIDTSSIADIGTYSLVFIAEVGSYLTSS